MKTIKPLKYFLKILCHCTARYSCDWTGCLLNMFEIWAIHCRLFNLLLYSQPTEKLQAGAFNYSMMLFNTQPLWSSASQHRHYDDPLNPAYKTITVKHELIRALMKLDKPVFFVCIPVYCGFLCSLDLREKKMYQRLCLITLKIPQGRIHKLCQKGQKIFTRAIS